jgi:predicted Rossmann-fold nucleotide-binding protein
LTLLQTQKIRALPVVLVGEKFWRKAFNVDFLLREGVISSADVALFTFAETARQIWSTITGWYEQEA